MRNVLLNSVFEIVHLLVGRVTEITVLPHP